MHQLAETIATMQNVIRGAIATATGAVASTSPAVTEAATVQYAVWGATIFAGVTTGAVALVRLWLDLRKAKG
jgi:hypothetical protein